MASTCKFYKQQKEVSYDNGLTWQPLDVYQKGDLIEYQSEACGGRTVYKWEAVSGEYICNDLHKYEKLQKYISYDNGITWKAVIPSEFTRGTVIEEYSEDCGAVTIYKWEAVSGDYVCDECENDDTDFKLKWVNSDGTEHTIPYDGNPILTTSDTASATSANTAMVTIGSNVTKIDNNAFERRVNLTTVIIPNSVTEIGNSAFYNCYNLVEVIVPNSVTRIGSHAFGNCTQLCKVILSNNLDGSCLSTDCELWNTFYNCDSLTQIVVPEGVRALNYTFAYSEGLCDVYLPSTIENIRSYTFGGCSNLANITIYATTPPQIERYTFDLTPRYKKIFVPSQSVEAYKQADWWSQYADNIYPIN